MIEWLSNAIRNVGVEVHYLRGAIVAQPAVTDADVDARARGVLAEHEHHEGLIALRDLKYALVGIAVQAIGAGIGVIAGL